MAATELSLSPNVSGRKPLTKTQGILLETMQLVEPSKSQPVPNHLLESKLYSKIAQNSVFQARPAIIHFGGFEIGQTQDAVLKVANVSTEVQRMHIIPPQTKFFKIKYTKNDRLVPGLTLDCRVEFTPDEWRYYYDCIRIHCKGEENLVIPIHAYPVMNTDDFPTQINFPPVPIGQTASRTVPLRCTAPIDFEFQLLYAQPHPAFTVEPMAGVVPANDEVDIRVTFSPSEFSTAHMALQLLISQFNAKPLTCNVTGTSAPGLAKELTEASHLMEAEESVLDPRSITPVDRIRSKRKKQKQQKNEENERQKERNKEIEKDGIKFPSNLDTPYSVAQVLNQEPGKLRMKDIREAVLAKQGHTVGSTRQMKEAMFEMAVRQDVYEERQNQLRWQVKIGDEPINNSARQEVLALRDQAWTEYKHQRGDPVVEEEYHRSCTKCEFRRTIRDKSEVGSDGIKFDLYTNDMWAVRHAALAKFQQAARKIIIRRRANHKLLSLRDTLINWGKRKYALRGSETDEEVFSKITKDDVAELTKKAELGEAEEGEDGVEKLLQRDRIKSLTFPTYAPPDVKDDMAVDALGRVPFKPLQVVVKKKVPYFDLKVPQQYSLMGYDVHNVHDASLSYVSPKLSKPLRSGAEDEVITLSPPAPAPPLAEIDSSEEEVVNEGDLEVEDVTGSTPAPPAETQPLRPPVAMFRPIDYPPLHIFNPAPGLQVFQPPLPYAETDSDFHLCPLPRYTSRLSEVPNPHNTTQKKYLEKEDVIKGVMGWKRFPSQGLTSLSNTPTLTNVWVPRWSDPVSDNLMADVPPVLAEGLSQVDSHTIQEAADDEEDAAGGSDDLQLTPEMVNAQFPLVDTTAPPPADDKSKKEETFPFGNKMPATNIPVSNSGPVPREKREQELEYFFRRKYNRLGNKFQQKLVNQDSLKSNPDLILK